MTDNLMWSEKYRPKEFKTMINTNEGNVSILKKMILSKCMPHLLFYGKPGTGKTTTILTCLKELYGENENCMSIKLNASDNRGIGVIRDIVKQFAEYNNILSINKHKFVILDEIDSQTKDAQSILKRIIEKYSNNTRFCLICNDINKVDPALQSRCAIFLFRPHTNQNIYNYLIYICKNEKIEYNDSSINKIIEMSNGDMRKSINTLQSIYLCFNKINYNYVCEYLNLCSPKNIESLYIDLINKTNYKKTYNFLLELVKKNVSFEYIIEEIANMLIIDKNVSENKKNFLLDKIGTIQYEMTVTNFINIFISSFVGVFFIDDKDYNIF